MPALKMLSRLSVCLALSILSCTRDDPPPADLTPPVVTGYNFTDEQGAPYPPKGVPNDKPFEREGYEAGVYPSPSHGYFSVYLHSPGSTLADLWIVPARSTVQPFKFIQRNKIYEIAPSPDAPASPPAILSAALAKIGGVPVFELHDIQVDRRKSVQIDIRSAPPGAYRVYFQMKEQLAWQNIYILPTE